MSQPPSSSPTPPRHEEHQYLDLVREILQDGELRPDRTGTGTYSIFAPRPLKFTLHRPAPSGPATDPIPILPLLTTKRVFTRAILGELLWFISGDTSSLTLSSQGIHIWDGNGSRSFLDAAGLSHRAEGDLGPVYGFQWRHFGAAYVDAATDYGGQGVDQLGGVVEALRARPFDRRIVVTAWNPADLDKMALPPCHLLAQFYVSDPAAPRGADRGHGREDQGGEASSGGPQHGQEEKNIPTPRHHLHCQLYQRSADMGLGVPFNIASYALLTHMLARAADLVPGSLTHVLGDAHVYRDHVDALRVQVEREPRPFPELVLRRPAGASIDGWKVEDFEIRGYEPHGVIQMKMSV